MRKKKLLIKIILTLTILIIIPITVFANFVPNTLVINENTKQCAKAYLGEKCTTCTLPEDWSTTNKVECPKEYGFVFIETECKPIKSPYCCTIQHEGNGGTCNDVVVNIIEEKCAFVKNISKCESLPENWKEADENSRRGKICPTIDYEWLEGPLSCKGDENTVSTIDQNNENQKIASKIIIITSIILIIIMMGYLLIRRKKEEEEERKN